MRSHLVALVDITDDGFDQDGQPFGPADVDDVWLTEIPCVPSVSFECGSPPTTAAVDLHESGEFIGRWDQLVPAGARPDHDQNGHVGLGEINVILRLWGQNCVHPDQLILEW